MRLEQVPATLSDIPYLLQLRQLTMAGYLADIGAPTDNDSLMQRVLYAFEHAYLVLADGKPAGLLKYAFVPDAQHWYLMQIQIHPDFQNRGLGRLLIESLIARASAQRQPVVLSVLKNNPARLLYQRLGFEITGEGDREFTMCHPPGKPT
ncbi:MULTISPECIES: GNAT family N-acetyltransferase [Dickeya]|uniref:Histone acetyltransferase HPA2 and related acetyltransferases n=1 Tax=Dickeya aquatica TaxID=1401087 RepID=A0A375ADH4_9GAMM|nr:MULTISPECIES: GNAT family N-acetyltransferase [Dickeya]SLM64158.1 Histone acetyltransferase HPA2 and related acetyltransferases [Dickeya aquatica]